MSDIKLPDCPFCGGPARPVKNKEKFGVLCRWCGCGIECNTEQEAIDEWKALVARIFK